MGEEAPPVSPMNLRDRNVLLLDLSKSMLAPLPDPHGEGGERQKIEVARTAVFRILQDAAKSGTPFGLVTFTEAVRVPVPLGAIHQENLPYIENLLSLLAPSGRSAIWDAIAVGSDLLRAGVNGVRGNLVLVTDGWDNASTKFFAGPAPVEPPKDGRVDLVPYVLPPNSDLSLRVVGIGSGTERDRGVDGAAMVAFLDRLRVRAQELGLPGAFSFQEVTTGVQLFAQMIQAFVDVGYDDDRPIEELHPEELARHAASAAKALKEPQQHATVGRLRPGVRPPPSEPAYTESPDLEVGVLSSSGGAPAYLRERYGPLGEVVEAYVGGQYDHALDLLSHARDVLPPVTRLYWEARIQFARKAIVEAARVLIDAWTEAERLPPSSAAPILRRLALLQARMQNDKETETLVRFIDDAEHRLGGTDEAVRDKLMDLFARLMELRGTYQLTRLAGESDLQDAALRHEAAVEEVFARLQDARLELSVAGPAVEGALDFIEICLAEMR
jgi:von Willebrand factor type A domain